MPGTPSPEVRDALLRAAEAAGFQHPDLVPRILDTITDPSQAAAAVARLAAERPSLVGPPPKPPILGGTPPRPSGGSRRPYCGPSGEFLGSEAARKLSLYQHMKKDGRYDPY